MLNDFLDQIESAPDQQKIWNICASFFADRGFSKTIYIHNDTAGPTMFTTLPQYWLDHYWEQDYIRIDPFFEHCCHTLKPVGTGVDYLEDHSFLGAPARQLIQEASEVGIRSGFSCTTKKLGPDGVGGWNLGSELSREETEKIQAEEGFELRLVAVYAHERLKSTRLISQNGLTLSPREKDCLCWSARGMRTKEIAERLALAPVSVELYLKNARKKLGASTREQAIAIAIINKLINV